MATARRSAAGAYLHEWQFPSVQGSIVAADAIDSIIEWCRETVGRTRRPWGIHEFDLAIAVARDGDPEPKSVSLKRLAPTELYSTGALLETLGHLFGSPADDADRPVVHVAVALFSWGDAAHAALPAGS